MSTTSPNPVFAPVPTPSSAGARAPAPVEAVDIALLLEGSAPFAAGDAPGWVERMIRAFPQYRFAVAFIGSRRQDCGEIAQALPPNLVHLQMHFLHEDEPAATAPREPACEHAQQQAFAKAARLHDLLRQRGRGGAAQAGALMREWMDELGDDGLLSEDAFLHSRPAWDAIVERYRRYCTDPSFSDYFWTVRTMHRPLWRLARIAATLMPARVYHAASAGYAGFLGAMLRYRHDRPLLVSQHAAHTREQGIALFEAYWHRDNRYRGNGYGDNAHAHAHPADGLVPDVSQLGYCRDLWQRFFEALDRVSYEAADEIVALYEGNRRRQVQDGAPASRTRTIPNGVDLPALVPLRAQRPHAVPQVLCLAGPVVRHKDVKTFIRAMLSVVRQCPDAQAWIAGTEDDDAEYARECRALAQSLGLAANVRFLGDGPFEALLPQIGVLVLCSTSEALPPAVLAAFAAGVPCVTTDVGACRELVDGVGDEDMALGPAGAVVRIADPGALAREAVALLSDAERWRAAQRAAIVRVERYYTQHATVASYRQLYQQLAAKPHAGAGGRGGVIRSAVFAAPAASPASAAGRMPAGRCPFAGAP